MDPNQQMQSQVPDDLLKRLAEMLRGVGFGQQALQRLTGSQNAISGLLFGGGGSGGGSGSSGGGSGGGGGLGVGEVEP